MTVSWCSVAAERRAQLQRSRSRQNVFQATPGADVVREINFDEPDDATPAEKQANRRRQQTGPDESGESEAEALLARLREL